jgi:TonB family protein
MRSLIVMIASTLVGCATQLEPAAKSTIPANRDAPERKCDRPTTMFPSLALSKIGPTPVRTTVRFELLASGQVGDVKIKESSGHKVLDDAAVTAAFKMKCTPLGASEKSEWLETWYEFKVQ